MLLAPQNALFGEGSPPLEIERLIQFILANRSQYSDRALRKGMLLKGWPPDAVDEAFRAVSGGRSRSGVFFILGAYVLLAAGGACTLPLLTMLDAGEPQDGLSIGLFIGGILLGASGTWPLLAGIRRWWPRGLAREPVTVWEVFAFGLLFPGAAQAYAGRWLWSGVFLLGPWVATDIIVLLALFSRALPPAAGVVAPALVAAVELLKPGLKMYILLWAISLSDGARWATSPAAEAKGADIPCGKAPALGFGLLLFFAAPLLFLQLLLIGAAFGAH